MFWKVSVRRNMKLTNERVRLALAFLATVIVCVFVVPSTVNKTYIRTILKNYAGNYTDMWTLEDAINEKSTDIDVSIQKSLSRNIEMPYLHEEMEVAKGLENIYLMWPISDRMRFRALCAAETWSFHNPTFNVWFVLTSDTIEDHDHLIERLEREYSNLKFVRAHIEKSFKGTIFEALANRKAWNESKWPGTMLSDLLRLALVSKSGGYYADSDALLFRNMTGIKNFAGLYDDNNLDSAIFHFDKGHPLLLALMNMIAGDFNPNDYSYNGPKALTRCAWKECPDTYLKKAEGDRAYVPCKGMDIMHHDRFFQPHNKYHNCEVYFQKNTGLDIDKIIADFAYGIHVCNVVTRVNLVEANSYYDIAARRWCPITHYAATLRGPLW